MSCFPRWFRTNFWAGFAAVVVPLDCAAFVFEVNSSGELRRWQLENPDSRVKASSVNRTTRSIIYRLDSGGFSTTNTTAELQALRSAFDQWQGISGTRVRFEEGPPLTGTRDVNSQDHTNSLFWTRSLTINGGRDNLRGVVALTYVASFRDGNVIFDADTVFNAAEYSWSTDYFAQGSQQVFVESIALHEIGHFLGLQHSPVGGATMLVSGEFGANAQLGLTSDEWTAARGLYPATGTAGEVGRIQGKVLASGVPVFGAAVFVENAQGQLLAGTVTSADGAFSALGLPPGTHSIRAAPLDSLTALNYLIRGADISATYNAAQTGFLPSSDRVVSLSGGGSVNGADLQVSGGAPLRIVRILRPATDLVAPSYSTYRAGVVADGSTRYVGVLTTAKVTDDPQLTLTGKGLELGPLEIRANAQPGLTLVAAPVTVATNAARGLRSFRIRAGNMSAWAHGFLEIEDIFPDVNTDGLDDRFQRQYWSRFTSPDAAPTTDADSDGFPNDWEFRTGTDPTDASSAHFEVESVRVTEAGAVVRSQAIVGQRFRLLGRDAVEGAPWTSVGVPVVAAGDSVELSDPGATRSVRFYRVERVP